MDIFPRHLTGRFDRGQQTSDAGGLLLREADRRLNLLPRFAACFKDGRDPQRIEHTVGQMTAQLVYGRRWVTKIFMIMNNYGTIRCWR